MIRLITGLPGSGKSLRAVFYVLKFLAEGRHVYSYGIPFVGVEGVEDLDDPNKWLDLPDGSVIVIDEAQKLWPTRRAADVPSAIRALSEHRHHGFDFIIITQHPTMVDKYVRTLTGLHEHVVRKFGMQAAQIYSWGEVQDDVQSSSARDVAENSLWFYPKELFSKYKSATLHTVKRRIPLRLVVFVAGVIFVPVLLFWGYRSFAGVVDPKAAVGALAATPASGPFRGRTEPDTLTTDEWVALHTPRIDGIPWSAPAYDRFEVVDYPRPICMISGDVGDINSSCKCWTQQVTRLDISAELCRSYVLNGLWDPHLAPAVNHVSGIVDDADDDVSVDRSARGVGEFLGESILREHIAPGSKESVQKFESHF